jgi:hypothetical protein
MKILQLLCSHRYYPENIPQLNCSTNCLQGNSSERTTQKTQHSPHIVVEVCLQLRCIATVAARTTQKTPFFYCRVHVAGIT